MRHGDALFGYPDKTRVLSPKGQAEVKSVVQQIIAAGIDIQKIYHSGFKRTMQTASLIADDFKKAANDSWDLITPDQNPEPIIESLSLWDKNTIIVTHMPLIQSLLDEIPADNHPESSVSFDTAMTCHLKGQGNQWHIEGFFKPQL